MNVFRVSFAIAALGAIILIGFLSFNTSTKTDIESFSELSGLENLRDSEGLTFDSSSLIGKSIVINFFASWCEPCRREIIEIQRINDRSYKPDKASNYLDEKSVVFVGINSGETDEVKAQQLITETKASYLILFGDDGTLLQEVGAVGLPFTIFVNTQGQIVGKHLTAMAADDVFNLLEKYFP